MQKIEVERGKTIILMVSLGFNVSESEFLCQMRQSESPESSLLATWAISFDTDGKDGELLATLDNSISSSIAMSTAWLFLDKVSESPPLPVFPEPLEVMIFG